MGNMEGFGAAMKAITHNLIAPHHGLLDEEVYINIHTDIQTNIPTYMHT